MPDATPTLTTLVDAYLLGEYFDYEPEAYPDGEAQFLVDIRRDYPVLVESGERVARRVMDALKDEGEGRG